SSASNLFLSLGLVRLTRSPLPFAPPSQTTSTSSPRAGLTSCSQLRPSRLSCAWKLASTGRSPGKRPSSSSACFHAAEPVLVSILRKAPTLSGTTEAAPPLEEPAPPPPPQPATRKAAPAASAPILSFTLTPPWGGAPSGSRLTQRDRPLLGQ